MLPPNVNLYQAIERQYSARIKKEAKNARLLSRLYKKDAEIKDLRAKEPVRRVEKLEEAHA